MSEIAITRRFDSESRRCPWCHEGETDGARWVTCRRDQTPIHASCLQEYGACPICRDPMGAVTASRTRRRSGSRDLRLEPVPELDPGLRAFVEAVRERYARRGDWLKLWSREPRKRVWLRGVSGEEAEELARQLVEGDADALQRPGRFQTSRRALRSLDLAIEASRERILASRRRAERALRDRRRIQLRRRTSIEEAQWVQGIGLRLIDALRVAGIRNLDDLRSVASLADIAGVDRDSAERLRSWVQVRDLAIERLLDAEPDPRVPENGRLTRERSALIDRRRALLREGQAHCEALRHWRQRRAKLLERLADLRGESDVS